MPRRLSAEEARFLRTAGQSLDGRGETASLPRVVASVVGINAQRSSAMMLSLRARVTGLRPLHVEEAIARERSLVRTWAMRGTIHLLAAEDVRWIVSTLAPTLMAKGRRRMDELGLDEDLLEKGLKKIRAALGGRVEPLTRWELMDLLAEEGIVLDRTTQAPIHLIRHAALAGLVCMGPERENGESTYVLCDGWLGKRHGGAGESGLSVLAKRYLDGFAPATARDFASWSGVTAADAKRALRDGETSGELVAVEVEGLKMWMPGDKPALLDTPSPRGHVVKLLPAFDTYVLGYADRTLVVPGGRLDDVYHGGQTLPVVLVDGIAAGVWRYERRGKRLAIEVRPFEAFEEITRSLVSKEADDIARFMGLPSTLEFA